MMGEKKEKLSTNKKGKKCFVIMPISDPEEYEDGHFKAVYEDIFIPAIKEAGYEPYRADDSRCSNMIQEEIIREIIESPMAICDLSTRNPNVLFELGVRQAFDLPVVLVQEQGTTRIFDISNINTIDYDGNLTYRNVMNVREKIKEFIKNMEDNTKGLNSIIKLLKVSRAEISSSSEMTETDEIKFLINSMRQDVDELKKSITSDYGCEKISEKEPYYFIKDPEKIGNYVKMLQKADLSTMSEKELMDYKKSKKNMYDMRPRTKYMKNDYE